ncbi:MAG: hypothetical protein ABSC56_09190 [Solirubrobacteraceae bacterium]|jgi:hypothetical protein
MPRVRQQLTLAAALVAALALTGGSAALGAKSSPATTLANYLVQGGEETGFVPAGKPSTFKTAEAWGSVLDAKGAPARLTKEGFVSALSEYTLYTPKRGSGGGISWAVELGSAANAKAEASADYKQLAVGSEGATVVERYALKGIADSRAWTSEALGFVSANVIFIEGRCVMLIGVERTQGGTGTNTVAPMEAAADSIYKHSHGTCP